LHWLNTRNIHLKDGFLEFFSNDIDGTFYLNIENCKIDINGTEKESANTFADFINKLLYG
jgi:hypothetical protein